jgi:alkanesulfonate monooxygenase SsuD/methylene tetrahydromethanopterin reductase-like flavin-dependent oxidoreductase (luciferase family)
MLEEAVEVVCRLWRDDAPVTFAGRHYALEECRSVPPPVRQPHPPLIIGGNAGPRSAALAARWADEYNVNNVTPQRVARQREQLAGACEAIGRDPATLRVSLLVNLLVGTDTADLHARAEMLMQRNRVTGSAADFVAGRGLDTLTGTVDAVLDQVAEYARAGVERILLQHWVHRDLESVELIGRRIRPEIEAIEPR